jgi:hypothetical protein
LELPKAILYFKVEKQWQKKKTHLLYLDHSEEKRYQTVANPDPEFWSYG